MTDIGDVLGEWLESMEAAGLSSRTIGDRALTLRVLARQLDPLTVTRRDITRYFADQREVWGPGTRHTRHVQVKAFYTWAVDVGHVEVNPMAKMKAPKAPQGVPNPISTNELTAILARVNRKRTRAMVVLAAYQGLRIHEVAKFRGEDIRGDTLRVRGKGGKVANLPLHPAVAKVAETFPRTGWWFPSYGCYGKAGGHVTGDNVGGVIKDAMQRAGIDGHAHQLRHWYGTQTLKSSGGNLLIAQKLLRHATVATTAIYAQVDDDDLRAAVAGLPTAD